MHINRPKEAESGHGRYYLFSFCYLEITKKIIPLSQDNGSFQISTCHLRRRLAWLKLFRRSHFRHAAGSDHYRPNLCLHEPHTHSGSRDDSSPEKFSGETSFVILWYQNDFFHDLEITEWKKIAATMAALGFHTIFSIQISLVNFTDFWLHPGALYMLMIWNIGRAVCCPDWHQNSADHRETVVEYTIKH